MKLQFDPNQTFQIDAINSITKIFEGQPLKDTFQNHHTNQESSSLIFAVANELFLTNEQILQNLKEVQTQNEIQISEKLEGLNFTVEMETGTGKTYVYLRTIYELNKQYGFKKFVIVVPSIAIRQGVLKNLEITQVHFQNLYDNIPVHYLVYDSSKVSSLRGFATSSNIEILVINIDSFAKDANIINRPNDNLNGQIPLEFIKATNPIAIVDEPQNMETDKRRNAIASLNPLCTLRYSATHKNLYNLVYSLNPVRAYDLGLVKQIEVDSIISEDTDVKAFISLDSVKATKTKVSARVTLDVNTDKGVKKKTVTVNVEDDLYKHSNERELYNQGYIVEEIDVSEESIKFSNGTTLYVGSSIGGFKDEIMKYQITKTVEEHLKKEKKLRDKGIKVLSLFFIDKVSNYRIYDDSGIPMNGKIANWFEEVYEKLSKDYRSGSKRGFSIDSIHDGYFSVDNKGKEKDTSGETNADYDTYKLIMDEKEILLDIDNPLRFIFSHSALREGWDNPNVFQICTLNETKSEMKKRQEIGRGLRLAVDQTGERIYDRNINKLTVIANESYEDFAKSLQKEIEDECGVSFSGRIKNRNERIKITYRKGFEADPKFLEIWEMIKQKTSYRVEYDTGYLIDKASKAIKELPRINKPRIKFEKKSVTYEDAGIGGELQSQNVKTIDLKDFQIPDVLGYIQSRTELTRTTILSILTESKRLKDVLINPQLFLDMAIKSIRGVLYELMIDGIKYEKIGNQEYEMHLFEDNELETYFDDLFHKVTKKQKTIYDDYIPLDSSIENQFAKDCESSEQVEFYFKLPNWFTIPTPIGTYNPDWALVFKDKSKIYFVTETKSTTDLSKLRPDEKLKIRCGEANYKEFPEVEYRHTNKLSNLL